MRRSFTLAILAVLLVPAVASAQTGRAGAPKTATLTKELTRLASAVSKSKALPARQRRALARHPRTAAKSVKAKRPCPAATSLLKLHSGIDRATRRAKGAKQKSLRKLQARGARDRQLVLRLVPKGRACGGTAAFSVDVTLQPAAKELPAIGGVKRPLARLADPYGNGVDFVADEVILSTDSRRDVAAFVKRWAGKLLQTVDVPSPGVDQHLIRIATTRAKLGRLGADAQKLSKTRGTDTRVSSEAGLGVLAAAAAESARGVEIGLDFVGTGADFAGGFSQEHPEGPGGWNVTGPGWTANAFQWEHLSAGGAIRTGVSSAWQLLAQHGRLQPRSVGLAVLDMGFEPGTNGPDWGTDVTAISNVPFVDALGTQNLLTCTASSRCPWHGTNVHNAAMAVAGNGFGVAGPAGPVARPIVVFTLYDFFTSIAAVAEAAAAGARVINMSYGTPLPAVVAWAADPFQLTTSAASAAGILLFAAAGNDTTDVDTEDCVIVCWEETLFTPCENAGVTCVGALAGGSRDPACYSNWGAGSVDLWAPGNVLVGLDPSFGGNVPRLASGTSVASPWTAGVAALTWSALPAAGAGAVASALSTRATPGGFTDRGCARPDGSFPTVARHQATRIVDADAAVRDVLPPLFRITGPANGTNQRHGTSIRFTSQAYDDNLGAPAITWRREGDATPLGTGPTLSRSDLPYGVNDIMATAIFPNGGPTIADRVRVTITNDAPSVEITSPQGGDTFFEASTINLRGTSFDLNEAGNRLTDDQVGWFLGEASTPFATGHDTTATGLSPGVHTIYLRGTDGQSTGSDSVTVTVSPNPADLPPTASITSPPNNSEYTAQGPAGGGYIDVDFTSTVDDPEKGPLTRAWTVSANGSSFKPISPRSGTLQNPTFRFAEDTTNDVCLEDTYDVRLTVTDSAGNSGTDTVRVRTIPAPC